MVNQWNFDRFRELLTLKPTACPVCGAVHYEEINIGKEISGRSCVRVLSYVQEATDWARAAYADGRNFRVIQSRLDAAIPWRRQIERGRVQDDRQYFDYVLSLVRSDLAIGQIRERLDRQASEVQTRLGGGQNKGPNGKVVDYGESPRFGDRLNLVGTECQASGDRQQKGT